MLQKNTRSHNSIVSGLIYEKVEGANFKVINPLVAELFSIN